MKHKEIVVVEDDGDIRELIRILLGSEQYSLKMYDSATAFREHMAGSSRPDIVVMDVMLPDGNGMELCRNMKQDPATGSIPVVLMSANSYEHIGEARADAFIPKPFNIDEFREKVEYCLAGR